MAQLISAWPSDPRSSVQSLVNPVKLSSDSSKFGFKYPQNGAVGESLKCSVGETMRCSFFVMLQIGIGVIAALIVLMILTMFGLWYKNRKYV